MKKTLLTILSLGSLVVSGGAATMVNAATVPPVANHITKIAGQHWLAAMAKRPQPGAKPVARFGQRPIMPGNSKLATLLNMTPADLMTALKSGKTIAQVAADHGVSQAQLDQFNAAQKQARLDNLKQQLAKEVASGKITQTQMDQRLTDMTNNKVRFGVTFGNQIHRGKPMNTTKAK